MAPHYNCLTQMILIRDQNVFSLKKIRKIIPELSLLLLLINSTAEVVDVLRFFSLYLICRSRLETASHWTKYISDRTLDKKE